MQQLEHALRFATLVKTARRGCKHVHTVGTDVDFVTFHWRTSPSLADNHRRVKARALSHIDYLGRSATHAGAAQTRCAPRGKRHVMHVPPPSQLSSVSHSCVQNALLPRSPYSDVQIGWPTKSQETPPTPSHCVSKVPPQPAERNRIKPMVRIRTPFGKSLLRHASESENRCARARHLVAEILAPITFGNEGE